jgi:hypothetical protein
MSAPFWRTAVASQYGAALDMLENAIRACPDALWDEASKQGWQRFWYYAFHTLWWHDHYLSEGDGAHVPPEPYTMDEMEPDRFPAAVYTPAQLLAFLEHGRARCRARFDRLTEAEATERCGFARLELSWLELFLYNLRHLQHHTAQLNLLIRQHTGSDAPRWVGRGR